MPTHRSKSPRRPGEKGSALILNLLLTAVIGALGGTLLIQALTETRTNANFRGSLQAFYAAKSGLEEARARVPVLSANPIALPAAVGDVIYIVKDADVHPASTSDPYYDSEFTLEFPDVDRGTPPAATSIQPAGSELPYRWVRITRKTETSAQHDIDRNGTLNSTTAVYWDGSSQNLTAGGKPVYVITALAVTPDGSRSMLQMEGSEPPPYSADSALASQDDVRLLGNFSVSGVDYCGSSSPVYGVKTTEEIDVSGNAGTISGLTGPSPNQTGTYEDAPSTYDIVTLINTLKPYATPIRQVDTTVTYSSSTNTYSGSNVHLGVPPPQPPPAGSTGTPVITYASGNVRLTSSNSVGDGILIVDGDLEVQGGLYYYGLIIVRGIVAFTGGGSSSVNIYGAIVSGSSITNTTSVGGGVNVQYDSCAIQNPYNAIPLKVLSFRELIEY
ncbi:MAG: pilus assembly PilX N-terminal domain-containing protein [Acidobacteria bacterium]|nr:pilus assembly PilX N-terminal domain-containing protein [Acidobacteriota bacterium]